MHLKLPSGNDSHVIQTLIWKHLWQAAAEKCAIFWRSILFRSIIHTKCDLVTGLNYMIWLLPNSSVLYVPSHNVMMFGKYVRIYTIYSPKIRV